MNYREQNRLNLEKNFVDGIPANELVGVSKGSAAGSSSVEQSLAGRNHFARWMGAELDALEAKFAEFSTVRSLQEKPSPR